MPPHHHRHPHHHPHHPPHHHHGRRRGHHSYRIGFRPPHPHHHHAEWYRTPDAIEDRLRRIEGLLKSSSRTEGTSWAAFEMGPDHRRAANGVVGALLVELLHELARERGITPDSYEGDSAAVDWTLPPHLREARRDSGDGNLPLRLLTHLCRSDQELEEVVQALGDGPEHDVATNVVFLNLIESLYDVIKGGRDRANRSLRESGLVQGAPRREDDSRHRGADRRSSRRSGDVRKARLGGRNESDDPERQSDPNRASWHAYGSSRPERKPRRRESDREPRSEWIVETRGRRNEEAPRAEEETGKRPTALDLAVRRSNPPRPVEDDRPHGLVEERHRRDEIPSADLVAKDEPTRSGSDSDSERSIFDWGFRLKFWKIRNGEEA